jgi:hypothetical protein
LVKTAKQGVEAATAPSRLLARIWVCIADILDGDLTTLERMNLLVWQPAHQKPQAVGQRHGSDGKKITMIDWRANRLVDALGKQAAEQVRATKVARDLVRSGREAVRHAACSLGQITFAANNHVVERLGEDGKMHTVTIRDSQDAPKKKYSASVKAACPAPTPLAEKVLKQRSAAGPLIPRSPAPPSKKQLAAARHRAARAMEERAALNRNLECRAGSFTRSASEPAPSKLEQVLTRIRRRICVGQAELL